MHTTRDSISVMIAAQADPPVCKIIDYGKFRFERDKKEKESEKRSSRSWTSRRSDFPAPLIPTTSRPKVNHARRFLTGGDKVKVIVKFKGREMSHLDVGRELLERFREACADLGGSDKAPSLDGRFMSVFITPNSKRRGRFSQQSKGKGKKPAATAAAATPEDKSAEKQFQRASEYKRSYRSKVSLSGQTSFAGQIRKIQQLERSSIMGKIKTHSGRILLKRFGVTKSGLVKMNHSHHRHNLGIKAQKRKRHLRSGAYLSPAFAATVKSLMPSK